MKISILMLALLFPVVNYLFSQRAEGQPENLLRSGNEDSIADDNTNLPKRSGDLQNSLPSAVQIPAPPAVTLPSPARVNGKAELPLNWRAKALVLAKEYPLKKNSKAWSLPVSYRTGQALLKEAVSESGLILNCEYDDAGQFLISIPESNKKGQIIVISQPVGEKMTLFKMHIYSDYQLFDNKRINCLPDMMKNLLENRGLLQ